MFINIRRNENTESATSASGVLFEQKYSYGAYQVVIADKLEIRWKFLRRREGAILHHMGGELEVQCYTKDLDTMMSLVVGIRRFENLLITGELSASSSC